MDYTFRFMRFKDGKSKAFTLSYDDGVDQDIRFMKILDKNGLKCTFNISAGRFAPEGTTYDEGRVGGRLMSKSQAIRTSLPIFSNLSLHLLLFLFKNISYSVKPIISESFLIPYFSQAIGSSSIIFLEA